MSLLRKSRNCVYRGWPALMCSGLALLVAAPRVLEPRIANAQTRAAEADKQLSEYEMKALLLARFVKYTRWPESAYESKDAPFLVAVLGKDPFGAALDEAFKDAKVGERKVKIVRGTDVAALGNAQLVFVAGRDEKQQQKLAEQFAGKPVLLVADTQRGAELGAQFGFYLDGNRVRFAANTASSKKAGLEVSSELLKHARIVAGAVDEGGARK
ncbi:MAG: YfiR family protein [Planctomycetota bacterium]|nr:MAG: YfiR family protein [Planctomycetota bacterium]